MTPALTPSLIAPHARAAFVADAEALIHAALSGLPLIAPPPGTLGFDMLQGALRATVEDLVELQSASLFFDDTDVARLSALLIEATRAVQASGAPEARSLAVLRLGLGQLATLCRGFAFEGQTRPEPNPIVIAELTALCSGVPSLVQSPPTPAPASPTINGLRLDTEPDDSRHVPRHPLPFAVPMPPSSGEHERELEELIGLVAQLKSRFKPDAGPRIHRLTTRVDLPTRKPLVHPAPAVSPAPALHAATPPAITPRPASTPAPRPAPARAAPARPQHTDNDGAPIAGFLNHIANSAAAAGIRIRVDPIDRALCLSQATLSELQPALARVIRAAAISGHGPSPILALSAQDQNGTLSVRLTRLGPYAHARVEIERAVEIERRREPLRALSATLTITSPAPARLVTTIGLPVEAAVH